jgi:hypothetical protein
LRQRDLLRRVAVRAEVGVGAGAELGDVRRTVAVAVAVLASSSSTSSAFSRLGMSRRRLNITERRVPAAAVCSARAADGRFDYAWRRLCSKKTCKNLGMLGL